MVQLISITVTDGGDLFFPLSVEPKETAENVKALIEVNTGLPLAEQVLVFNNRELPNAQTLEAAGVKDHDLVLVQRRRASAPPQQAQQNNEASVPAAQFRDYVMSQPDILQQMRHNNPAIATAVANNDLATIERFLVDQEKKKREAEARRAQEIAMLNADPFDVDAQRKIEEAIRLENVNENMENAMEHAPESFGRVIMLYVDCHVNNVPVKAFIDTGAQSTIMSERCAERCGIMRLMDTRFSGMAKGVGTARILGRVHLAPIKIERSFFPCSFTILESQDMDFILGLDMLKKYQCTIDLNKGELHIGGEQAPFLSEKDLPQSVKDSDAGELHPHQPPPTHTTSTTTTTTSTPSPAPVPAPHPSGPGAPAPASSPAVSEQAVQQLMQLGASREEATRVLAICGGNVELAAGSLFGV
eukprot:TRINITY_DN1700_c0_g1_i1.p1 TRINITY_DN1700_c0_g1~~TRINITY_DN1700_c0_g1_i1.p1  ORF type:complete len:416 (-),score=131.40 TRINITY_DN1700_c0_g1_i1:26-1273(-)